MTRYEYLLEIKEDLRNKYLIENNGDFEKDYNTIYDECFVDDSITGNASGSYYCNSYKASEAIRGAEDVLQEALVEFGCDAETIAKHMFDYEYLDCTIRCYLLGEAIEDFLNELEEGDED